MTFLSHFWTRGIQRWKRTRIEFKIALLSMLAAAVVALVPVFMVYEPPEGRLKLIDLQTSAQPVGSSMFSVVDLKLENVGGQPLRLSAVRISVEKAFLFDVPAPPQFRVPATGLYNASLSELGPGDSIDVGLFHQVDGGSSDRIVIVLGGRGFEIGPRGSLVRREPSYLSRIVVSFLSGDEVLARSAPFDVFVVNLDRGEESSIESEEIVEAVESASLAPMTTGAISTVLQRINLAAPEWLE